MDPVEKLEALLAKKGWSHTEAAAQAGCHHTMIGLLLRRKRYPGRRLANSLERLSANLPGGPIRSEDWDLLEDDDDRLTDLAESESLPAPDSVPPGPECDCFLGDDDI